MAATTARTPSGTAAPPASRQGAPWRTTIKAFIERHAVPTYYALVFAISWGGMLLVLGPGLFSGSTSSSSWQSDPLYPFALLALVAGPPVAGLLMTGLLDGRAGYRELLARLLRWRVGARWYAVALLTAPLVMTAILFALSLFSPEFLPTIVTAEDKASPLLLGIAVGLGGALLEELGWTGFVIPQLRRRYSVLSTGLLVGVLWAAWHLLQGLWTGGTYAGALPPALFLSLNILAGVGYLSAYRVLMGWVYDRTGSLLVAILMHAMLIASTMAGFILVPAAIAGVPFLTMFLAFTAVLWVVVAAVVVAAGGQLSRHPPRTPVA